MARGSGQSLPGNEGYSVFVPVCFSQFPRERRDGLFRSATTEPLLTFLGLICVIVDPTTAGLGDSDRALGYVEPWDDNRE
ncbi:MAG: phage holin [Eubacteriales bacterium]